jgi:lysophospholipase L1-like esterase
MVGDSMSVNEFGESMERYLVNRFERKNVAFYASCGSSPEHWLRNGPVYVTKCGYRELSSRGDIVHDFEHGHPPQPTRTPRLEDLLPSFRPTIVIVQLGTNWMDAIKARKVPNDERYRTILNDFVTALHCQPGPFPQIIWITPPDASRFSPAVKLTVQNLIEESAKRNKFQTINSHKMFPYVAGKSGGDGVHFCAKDAKIRAGKVTSELDTLIR